MVRVHSEEVIIVVRSHTASYISEATLELLVTITYGLHIAELFADFAVECLVLLTI